MSDILSLKKELGSRMIIAAHHYQRPEIVALADILGDSYKLAVEAGRSSAEFIVLCGVRFMAESAAILASEKQTVLLPDHTAGCPMADMIDRMTAETVLGKLRALSGKPVVPVTYMNSWADLKAFTGERGGSICTSGNAKKIIAHFLDSGTPVFFLPDFNLGMNTARELGLKDSEIWSAGKDGTISGDGKPEDAKIFLWDGFCRVHKVFTVTDIKTARARVPGTKVIVHPECTPDVVALADKAGSTEAMYHMLKDAPEGSSWTVGTEARFVDRMIQEFPGKNIQHLRLSFCQNMNRIDLNNLESTIESVKRHLETGERLPAITVTPQERIHAAAALNTMVRITEAG